MFDRLASSGFCFLLVCLFKYRMVLKRWEEQEVENGTMKEKPRETYKWENGTRRWRGTVRNWTSVWHRERTGTASSSLGSSQRFGWNNAHVGATWASWSLRDLKVTSHFPKRIIMSIKETFNHFKNNKEGLSKMLSLDLGVESPIVGEKISQGTHQGLNWILGGQ